MLSLQSNQSNAMQVHVTPNHDTSLCSSDVTIMWDLCMDNDLEVEIYDYLSGDDYADAMMKDIQG